MNKFPKGSSAPLKDHLNKVYETTGKLPDQLKNRPSMPDGCMYLWNMFCQIYSGDRLSYTEVSSFLKLSGYFLSGPEVEALFELDRLARKIDQEDV